MAVVLPFETAEELKPRNRVDELVFARWKELGVQPARVCSDAVFLRRAWLDLTGTLPGAKQAGDFLADNAPDKRSALIDHLLTREEFTDYQAMKWSDLLRVKAEFPVNLWPNAAQAYYHWIRDSVRENKPYDRFARELLTSTGSNFRSPAVNFYRAMQNREPAGIAQTVALTFMGSRTEKISTDYFANLATKKTGEWKEEILYSKGPDRRVGFADWLITPKNPWFTRAIVNRVWSWMLGRGIIHEPDDIRPDNPPENPKLLAFLQQDLISARYDLKQLFRLIANSAVYQLSSIAADPKGQEHFAAYPVRRLDAEVLIDALCQITGTSETYTSAIPEPYTFMPDFQRAVSLPDGSISSSFLELFGRPNRDTGYESERNPRMTSAQRLHLLNSSHVMRKIQQMPRFNDPRQLWLTVLCRYPTDAELKLLRSSDRRDIVWALFNSTEFLYRH